MKDAGFVRDEEKLDQFIAHPDDVVPNNEAIGGLASADDLAKIIAFLRSMTTGRLIRPARRRQSREAFEREVAIEVVSALEFWQLSPVGFRAMIPQKSTFFQARRDLLVSAASRRFSLRF